MSSEFKTTDLGFAFQFSAVPKEFEPQNKRNITERGKRIEYDYEKLVDQNDKVSKN